MVDSEGDFGVALIDWGERNLAESQQLFELANSPGKRELFAVLEHYDVFAFEEGLEFLDLLDVD